MHVTNTTDPTPRHRFVGAGLFPSRWRSILVGMPLMIGVSACGGTEARPEGEGSTSIEAPWTYTYQQSGGFAGINRRLTVSSDGKAAYDPGRVGQPQTTTLPADAPKALATRIERADLFHQKDAYRCKGCADQFMYTVTLKSGSRERTVAWEDQSDAPPALLELGSASEQLIQQYLVAPAQ